MDQQIVAEPTTFSKKKLSFQKTKNETKLRGF
jgi:hypothetical protein